ncbi:MAG: signal peptidase I [Frankia sp.]|nr:signal peptidase I [Frankia sp.]
MRAHDPGLPGATSVPGPDRQPGAAGPPVGDRAASTSAGDRAAGGSAGGRAGTEPAVGGSRPAGRWTTTGRRSSGRGRRRANSKGSFLRELPVLVLIAFVLALLIKALLVQAFWIPSESMERTLLINDRVLVNKVVYHFRDIHRGDIVVFNGEGTGFEHAEGLVQEPTNGFSKFIRGIQNLLGLGAPSDKDFIKRVIGVGGDTVSCCDHAGRVVVNGEPLDEPYVYENDSQPFDPVTVPEGQLWVMGDHRSASADSRYNGTIPEDSVVGRAFVRVWPLSRFGFLTSPDTFDDVPAPGGERAAADGDPLVGAPMSLPLAAALGLAAGAPGARRGGRWADGRTRRWWQRSR